MLNGQWYSDILNLDFHILIKQCFLLIFPQSRNRKRIMHLRKLKFLKEVCDG
jgi:hypothetical protein